MYAASFNFLTGVHSVTIDFTEHEKLTMVLAAAKSSNRALLELALRDYDAPRRPDPVASFDAFSGLVVSSPTDA